MLGRGGREPALSLIALVPIASMGILAFEAINRLLLAGRGPQALRNHARDGRRMAHPGSGRLAQTILLVWALDRAPECR